MLNGIIGMKWGVRKASAIDENRETQMGEVLNKLMKEQKMLKEYAENGMATDEYVEWTTERTIEYAQELMSLLKGN